MRIYLLLYLGFVCLGFSSAKAQFPFLVSQQFLGTQRTDHPRKLVWATDSTLIIGGYNEAEKTENCTDVFLIKTDTTGNIIWTKQIEREGCQELRGMMPIEDGGVIFVGVTNLIAEHPESSDAEFHSDAWVVRLDKKGKIVWERYFGGKEIDIANAIDAVEKECFIVGGSFSSDRDVLLNRGGSDIWGFRMNQEGKIKFLKTIGGKGNEWVQTIATCKNGDYVMAGFTNSPELDVDNPMTRNGNALVIRIRKTGATVWVRSFPAQYGGIFQDIQEDMEGKLIVTGSFNQTPENVQFWLLKLNAEGKVFFDKKMGTANDEFFQTVTVCSDSTYLVGGYTRNKGEYDPYSKGKEDFVLFKFDREGKTIWRKNFGGPDYERCVDVCESAPGSFFAIGEKDNYFTGTKDGNKDIWLLKLKEYPCTAEVIRPDIFVRADENNKAPVNHPIRFRARYDYGEKFLWNFGDGTTSTEAEPLKTYKNTGEYPIRLTISLNESCKVDYALPQPLVVIPKNK